MKNDNTRNIRARYQLDTYTGLKAYAESRPNGIRKVTGTGSPTSIFTAKDTHGEYVAIKLYHTVVYEHHANGIQVVSPRDYHTTTTRQRIGMALTHGWSIFQKNFTWYAAHISGTKYVLHDSLVLLPNGIAGHSLAIAYQIVGIKTADQLDSLDKPREEMPVTLINIDYELDDTWAFIGNGIKRADYNGALFVWTEPGDHLAIWATRYGCLYNILPNEPLELIYFQ